MSELRIPMSQIAQLSLVSAVSRKLARYTDFYLHDFQAFDQDVQHVMDELMFDYTCDCFLHIPWNTCLLDHSHANPHIAFCKNCNRPWYRASYLSVPAPHQKKLVMTWSSYVRAEWTYEERTKPNQHGLINVLRNGVPEVYELYSDVQAFKALKVT